MAASYVPASFLKMLFSKSLIGNFLRNYNYQLYGTDPTRDISAPRELSYHIASNFRGTIFIFMAFVANNIFMTIKLQMFHASSLNIIIGCGMNTHSIIIIMLRFANVYSRLANK